MDYIAEDTNFKLENCAVTLGKFDGLHLGHQLLMDQVISMKNQGYKAVMFSFSLHPGNLFSEKEFETIYTEEEKVNRLKRTGLDTLVSYPFTQETRNIEPEDFIREILVGKLDAKVIVVGNDFRFGRMRRGDIQLLGSLAETFGYQLIACDKMKWKDTYISSSRIRDELREGNMEAVNAMLGQPYSILGTVQHGRRIGRTLGIPTTNLIPASGKLLPPNGVYFTKTIIDGIAYPGVTNIGFKPTVGEEEQKGVETYLLDFDRDLYGKTIEVELYDYHRPELKFDTLEALKSKMQEDIYYTRRYFNI